MKKHAAVNIIAAPDAPAAVRVSVYVLRAQFACGENWPLLIIVFVPAAEDVMKFAQQV